MIALPLNNYVWSNLTTDATFSARYNKYRAQFGQNFLPFFPAVDNNAGDVSWGAEPYILYDSISVRPTRQVYGEKQEQVMYTLVAQMPELMEFKEKIIKMFDFWTETTFSTSGYRVNDINVWQPDRIRGRDKLRQTYSITLLFDIYYFEC